jgi:hypothetical protein
MLHLKNCCNIWGKHIRACGHNSKAKGGFFSESEIRFSNLQIYKKNYRTRAIITRGLYTFYPLFEVHLCTVTFGQSRAGYSGARTVL